MDMVLAGLRHIAATDPTALATQAQAECLQALEQGDAIGTAVRARFLAAFTAGQGYADDGDYSPADDILITAARSGAREEDLAALAAEIYERSLPDQQDDGDPELSFEDRKVRVETTFAGAGVIRGDLTPECAAVVTAVLESLSAPAGAEDTRSREQRYHDGLQEAMRRLAASGLLPERAGQPVKAWVHISLAELRALDDGSRLETRWVTEMRIRWTAHRAAASSGGSDGGAWLDGAAPRAAAGDAAIAPLVTGDINPAILDDLVDLCLHLAGHGPRCTPRPGAD